MFFSLDCKRVLCLRQRQVNFSNIETAKMSFFTIRFLEDELISVQQDSICGWVIDVVFRSAKIRKRWTDGTDFYILWNFTNEAKKKQKENFSRCIMNYSALSRGSRYTSKCRGGSVISADPIRFHRIAPKGYRVVYVLSHYSLLSHFST